MVSTPTTTLSPPPLGTRVLHVPRNHVTSPPRSWLHPLPYRRTPGTAGPRPRPGPTLGPSAVATWKPRLPAHGAGRPLRHLRPPLPAFPATSRRAALATRLYGQLPALLPLAGGGFRAAMACFRWPAAGDVIVSARLVPERAVDARCRGVPGSGEILGRRVARERREGRGEQRAAQRGYGDLSFGGRRGDADRRKCGERKEK